MRQKILILACSLVIGFGGWRLLSSNLVSGGGLEPAGVRVLNVETQKRLHLKLDRDLMLRWPAECPDTGRKSCYPAEICYWKQCGQKDGGTWVVLNDTLGKEGPTKCPECGHAVVAHNPRPPGFGGGDRRDPAPPAATDRKPGGRR